MVMGRRLGDTKQPGGHVHRNGQNVGVLNQLDISHMSLFVFHTPNCGTGLLTLSMTVKVYMGKDVSMNEKVKESSSSFDVKGRQITASLVITDDVIAWRFPMVNKKGNATEWSGMGSFGAHWNHVGPVIEPTRVTGVICPSEYVVTGLDVDLSFKLVRDETNQRYGITNIVVSGRNGETVTSKQLDVIPVELLTRAAIRAGGVTGILRPLNDNEILSLDILSPGVRDGFDQMLSLTLTGRGTLTEGEWIHIDGDTMVGKRRRVNAISDDELRRVADAYLDAHAGDRVESVVRLCGPMSTRTARRWIDKARKAGYLPPIPDTDKRKATQ